MVFENSHMIPIYCSKTLLNPTILPLWMSDIVKSATKSQKFGGMCTDFDDSHVVHKPASRMRSVTSVITFGGGY